MRHAARLWDRYIHAEGDAIYKFDIGRGNRGAGRSNPKEMIQ